MCCEGFSSIWEKYVEFCDECILYQNDSMPRIKVFESINGKSVIIDDIKYKHFLNIGKNIGILCFKDFENAGLIKSKVSKSELNTNSVWNRFSYQMIVVTTIGVVGVVCGFLWIKYFK